MVARESVDERLVAEIWERQAFDPRCLLDLGIRVVFRGVPSDAGGPDYQDALLATSGGSLLQGDIEFHVLTSDWRRHHHDADAKYNNVVLHVVWRDDLEPVHREDSRTVPTVALAQAVEPDRLSRRDRIPMLVQHRCVSTLGKLSPAELALRVAELGWARFAELEDRFAGELESEHPDQVLYAALMEGLGYASNRQVFRRLADAVPYAWLMSVPEDTRLATLLCAAGFGVESAVRPPARLSVDSWRLSRLRPANHPEIRIEGAMDVILRLGPSLSTALSDVVASAARPAAVRKALMSKGPSKAIGRGRADEIAVSVALPFVSALEPGLAGPRTLYQSFPAPPFTRWTRTMMGLLSAGGHEIVVRNALQHQGLHLLYTRYCRREGPRDCPVCGSAQAESGSGSMSYQSEPILSSTSSGTLSSMACSMASRTKTATSSTSRRGTSRTSSSCT